MAFKKAKSTDRPLTKAKTIEALSTETELSKKDVAGLLAALADLACTQAGVGFTIPGAGEPGQAGHSGLSELKDQIEELGGTLQITSEHSVGTTIRARVPTGYETPKNLNAQSANYYVGTQKSG